MLEEARLTSCNFVLSRSLLAVAQLGFVSGLFVPGFSRNPCQKGELAVWVPLRSSAPSLLSSPSGWSPLAPCRGCADACPAFPFPPHLIVKCRRQTRRSRKFLWFPHPPLSWVLETSWQEDALGRRYRSPPAPRQGLLLAFLPEMDLDFYINISGT